MNRLLVYLLVLFLYGQSIIANFSIDCRHWKDFAGTKFYFNPNGELIGIFQQPYGKTVKTWNSLKFKFTNANKDLLITGDGFYVRFEMSFRENGNFYGVGSDFNGEQAFNFYTDNCTIFYE